MGVILQQILLIYCQYLKKCFFFIFPKNPIIHKLHHLLFFSTCQIINISLSHKRGIYGVFPFQIKIRGTLLLSIMLPCNKK